MARSELKVDVKVGVSVEEKDAKGFLWLVEQYCNSNAMKIVEETTECGEVSLHYEPVR